MKAPGFLSVAFLLYWLSCTVVRCIESGVTNNKPQDLVTIEFSNHDAICYAVRYPDLLQGFCANSNPQTCDHESLWLHYQKYGERMSMIWGCRDRRTAATEAIPFDGPLSTQEETHDLHLLVYETSQTKATEMKLLLQSKEEGIPTTIFGINTEFEGFGSKWKAVKPWLQELPANSLVVIGDARDVLLNIHKNDPSKGKQVINAFVRSYETLTIDSPSAVIMSAEGQCCVSALTYAVPGDYFDATTGKRRARACASGRDGCHWAGDSKKIPWEDLQQHVAEQQTGLDTLEDIYLNAGLVAGTVEDLVQLIELANMDTFEDDQAVFTDLMYMFPDRIRLDYQHEMFGNARWTKGMEGGGCPFDVVGTSMSLQHSESKTFPLFLHTPGKFFECFHSLVDHVGIAEENVERKEQKRRGIRHISTMVEHPTPSPTESAVPSFMPSMSLSPSDECNAKPNPVCEENDYNEAKLGENTSFRLDYSGNLTMDAYVLLLNSTITAYNLEALDNCWPRRVFCASLFDENRTILATTCDNITDFNIIDEEPRKRRLQQPKNLTDTRQPTNLTVARSRRFILQASSNCPQCPQEDDLCGICGWCFYRRRGLQMQVSMDLNRTSIFDEELANSGDECCCPAGAEASYTPPTEAEFFYRTNEVFEEVGLDPVTLLEEEDAVDNYGNYGDGGRRLNRALLRSIVYNPGSQGTVQVP